MKNHPELTVERFHAKRKYIEGNEYPPESQEERMMSELPETRTMVSQWFDIRESKPTRIDALTTSDFGADIEAEQVFQQELHGIVDDMKVKLVDEKKILEGTLKVEYGKGDWTMPHIHENELSQSKPIEQQWKRDSQNGCLTTDPTPISTIESNNSACFADLFNQDYPITQSDGRSILSSTDSCSERLDASGTETDVMNECSVCMVPMINEQMDGMPNEVKW